MLKVVLISYHYPPGEAVGGLRAENVVKAFRRAGHEVHVITARLPEEEDVFRHFEPGLVVETVRPWTSPRWWYVNLKRRIAGSTVAATGKPSPTADAGAFPAASRPVPRWKRWISALLWLPDDKQGFIPPAVRAGLRARRAGANLIYTTVPPFSAHLAGLLLSWLTGMRWVLEFRDPWSDSHFRQPDQRSRWTSAIERWLERRSLERATLVVSVSDGIQHGLTAKVTQDDQKKFLVIRNGIGELKPLPAWARHSKPFRILHVGSFYHRRTPFPFLEGLAGVVRRRNLTTEDVMVEFVGNCSEYRGTSVAARAGELGLGGILAIRDWVPHTEAQRLVREADMLLLFAQDQPAQIPNKLYDYLGARVPIMAFADDQGESARMLRQVGGHHVITGDDAASAERAIASAFDSGVPTAVGNPELLEEWTTERQMVRLIAAVELSLEGVVDGQPGSVAARAAV